VEELLNLAIEVFPRLRQDLEQFIEFLQNLHEQASRQKRPG